jgi:CHAT domain-containing protein
MTAEPDSKGTTGPAAQPGDAAVLVEYFAIGARMVVFVMRQTSDALEAQELDIDPGRVEELASGPVFTASGVPAEETPAHGPAEWAQVSAALIAPVLRSCAPGEVVWFVGHGGLHVLPLHAAPLPDGGYLIDRNPVCYTPSATVMRFCQERRRDRRRGGLVVGDPDGDLPHAAEEARSVARVLGGEPLLRSSATRDEVLRRLVQSSPSFLHFACHGYFDPVNPMSSGIELSSGQQGDGRQRLTASDVLRLELSPSLVTLSACRTGLQQRRAGDELLGLARALLYAGTPSAVLALWNVEDLSTRLLMERFYRTLIGAAPGSGGPGAQAATLADALRSAQVYIRSLTAGAAAATLDDAIAAERDDSAGRPALFVARARIQAAAGDFIAAADSYETALGLLQEAPASEDRRIAASLDRTVKLLRFKGRRSLPPDYERRPFANPYHWAPFMLYGDWW